jgi:signal transduction histidine kinase
MGTDGSANEVRLSKLRARMTQLGIVAFLGLQLEVAASIWGRWTAVFALAALFGVAVALNLSVIRLAPRMGARWAERTRSLGTVLLILAVCHISGWRFPALAMIVMLGSVQGVTVGPESIGLGLVTAALSGGVAALDGAGALTSLTLATAVQGGFWLVYGGARVGSDLLDQLEARHVELAAAHAELRRMQEVAIQQDKLAGLGLMAAGIAHEINNPMAFVTSNVSSLLAELRGAKVLPTVFREYVDEVLPETLDGIRRVNAIVADLQRFSRGDAAASEAYDLNEQVDQALRIAQGQLGHRCQVVRELGTLPKLKGRPQQIVQVVVNLVVNAAQSLGKTGVVTVSTRRDRSEVSVSVADTGSGMTPEVRKHLFEPFFTTKPVGQGTGLGLAVIHGIVKAHGGRIEVESEPGCGSCFTVYLPFRSEIIQLPAREPASTALAGSDLG